MNTIHKYTLAISGKHQEVKMFRGSTILTVADKSGNPTIWAQVDTDADVIKRTFIVVGTGHPLGTDINWNLTYIGTSFGKILVWHIYEVQT